LKRRYQGKYQLPHQKKKRSGASFWLVVLLLSGLCFWLWWNQYKREAPKPAASNPVVAAPTSVATNVPTLAPTTVVRPVLAAPTPAPQQPQVVVSPGTFPRPARDTMEIQIALARQAISPGSIDGVFGSQTRAALVAFQLKAGLPQTAALDSDTRAALLLTSPPVGGYIVTSNDLARLQPLSKTWLGKSQQSSLDYETILELVAERGRASPTLIRTLNPGVDWTNIVAGTEVKIPDVAYPQPTAKAAFAVISLSEKRLQVFGAETNLLAHFPCSIAARVEKRPAGELHVAVVAPNPNYTFDPEIFPESAEGRQLGRKLVLPPGPNNPVGVAWVGLDQPGYGIHGTPVPELVGRTESHGCFRLANWNAEYFLKLVWMGMPVYVEQ
jgi:lipoprotein-anchoring transpeptidase ErfK/SrfK